MTDTAAVAIPTACIFFALGTLAYPAYEWTRGWWERVQPTKWKYYDVCGKKCRIRA